MITISTCLIVKDEEKVLDRCLESVKPFSDEIIIIDTGSSDSTKAIAQRYTDKIYDFTWNHDFAQARNESFNKATMDYIYVADADELIDQANINKIIQLKSVLLPEIDIVQMLYTNQLEYNTTYNFDRELRPKLYKRQRTFRWIDPIHESVQLDPVIYDSEIEIIHKPTSNHAKRDFSVYQRAIQTTSKLNSKLNIMYAKELFIAGDEDDFLNAKEYFKSLLNHELSVNELKAVQCVLVKAERIIGNYMDMMKHALKNVALEETSSEVCFELGQYYYNIGDYQEASLWFYNAAYETSSELNIHYQGDYPLEYLCKSYEILGDYEQSNHYKRQYNEWKMSLKK